MSKILRHIFLPVLCFIYIAGCTTVASFDQRAYEQATSLKAQSMVLMDKAETPYADNNVEAETLILDINKAYEYAYGLNKNKFSTQQYAIIKDPQQESIVKFLKFWKEKKTLNRFYIDASKQNIGKQFDQIIELESGKIKSSEPKK